MKKIYLIRHAKSSWDDPGLSDIERPLNHRGLRDAPFMSKMLKGKNVTPNKLISSPANRAFTTATYFAKELNIPEQAIVIRKEVYHAYPEEVLNQLLRKGKQTVVTIPNFGYWKVRLH